MKKKVVVGMSGGVDSSAAAYLLKEEGYDVIGVTMEMWQEGPRGGADNGAAESGVHCTSAADDARRVAEVLGIPHHVLDFREVFRERVVSYFIDEYRQGRTPNPCIMCNRYVKWEALLEKARDFGADLVATGHYARVEQLPDGRYSVRTSVSSAKDQTYALYQLTQEQLRHTLMPDGSYTKDEIRAAAERAGLPVAHKPDSMEICFIPDNDYAGFIGRNADRVPPPGNFVLEDGTVLGQHRGITHYTVGQRKGLGLAMGHPVFVKEIRPETGEVVIGEAESIFTRELRADRLNWMAVEGPGGGPLRAVGKIRYNHKGAPCLVMDEGDGTVRVVFDEPVRAVTPGQAVVFYQDGGYVLGGGIIL